MSGVVWFEVPAQETARARSFYGRLLGWQFEPFEGNPEYHVAGEAGGAVHAGEGGAGLLVYFGVDDLAAAVAQVRELGGRADDAQPIPGVGTYARCTDTEGNAFGLYQPAT